MGRRSSLLVERQYAEALTGEPTPDVLTLRLALRDRLSDVLMERSGWGFATAGRPEEPGIELVKLIRGGQRPRIAFDPQLTTGHLFRSSHRGGRWVLRELDGPEPAGPSP